MYGVFNYQQQNLFVIFSYTWYGTNISAVCDTWYIHQKPENFQLLCSLLSGMIFHVCCHCHCCCSCCRCCYCPCCCRCCGCGCCCYCCRCCCSCGRPPPPPPSLPKGSTSRTVRACKHFPPLFNLRGIDAALRFFLEGRGAADAR